MMLQRILLATTVTGICSASPATADEGLSCPGASTQSELNDCARESFRATDAELNRVYQRILREYADEPTFIEKLRKAQRAWLAFRDAEFEAQYPHAHDDAHWHYGSIWPVCFNLAVEQLTRERIKQLRKWLDGVEEGDMCAGSVRFR